MPYRVKFFFVVCFFSISASSVIAEQKKEFTSQLYWGDTHLHTSYSPDASLNGNTKIGPEEAFRFAKGEAIESHNGTMAQLERPLDFLVVADHAEYLGLLPKIRAQDALVMKNSITRRWGELIATGKKEQTWKAMFEVLNDIEVNKRSFDDTAIRTSAWDYSITAADRMNTPGEFTAFIGFEWTSMPGGSNLHRVVIFRDGADRAGQVLPFSSFDSEDPEKLWVYMEDYEKQTGGKAIAIPHNGNMSNGMMFQTMDFAGKPIDADYALNRARWEPLYEVTQIKGDGETHPQLSPEDPFADFENWDKGNLTASAAKRADMLKYEYARSALKNGLALEERIGVNPFQFGLIGSSDAHTGFAAVAENNFWGKFSIYEPGLHRLGDQPVKKGKNGKAYNLWAYEMVASGYAAVWARENTRAALFDAMKRKETYATTGSRISLQLFAGWDFTKADVTSVNFAQLGYEKGVPMGGTLFAPPEDKVPVFIISALKDPDGVALQRIQIIKGWQDEKEQPHEKVFDVALNDSGAASLAAYWQDESFDTNQRAFYYVRVLEVPKERWSTLEAKRLQVELPKQVPVQIQDRAYSSPIWYDPIKRH